MKVFRLGVIALGILSLLACSMASWKVTYLTAKGDFEIGKDLQALSVTFGKRGFATFTLAATRKNQTAFKPGRSFTLLTIEKVEPRHGQIANVIFKLPLRECLITSVKKRKRKGVKTLLISVHGKPIRPLYYSSIQ